MIRAYFIRQWLTENGMLPELSALTATDKENKLSLNLFDLAIRHGNQINVSMLEGVLKLTELYKKVDTKLEEIGAEGSDSPSGGDGGDTGSGEGDTGDGFDGEPDFGADFGAEEPAPEETTEETTPTKTNTEEPPTEETKPAEDTEPKE